MRHTHEWVNIGLVLIWLLIPWILLSLAWWKWARSRAAGNPIEEFIDDPAFLGGQVLATVSCCALVPLFVSHLIGYGLIISATSGLIGAAVLPFGFKRAKWLSFVSCLLNAATVVVFMLVQSV